MIDVNTVSQNKTHFLRAVELIKHARDEYNVPSENWPYPTDMRFGIPNDHYYAEVWTDGMDWQPSYWILEEYNCEKPHISPLIIFNHHEERSKFNDHDFEELVRAVTYYRRDTLWIGSDDWGIYSDFTWPYINLFKDEIRNKNCKLYSFEHASQERVVFWMNINFIPEEYRGKREKNNSSDRNPTQE